jgi:hypothetical protein
MCYYCHYNHGFRRGPWLHRVLGYYTRGGLGYNLDAAAHRSVVCRSLFNLYSRFYVHWRAIAFAQRLEEMRLHYVRRRAIVRLCRRPRALYVQWLCQLRLSLVKWRGLPRWQCGRLAHGYLDLVAISLIGEFSALRPKRRRNDEMLTLRRSRRTWDTLDALW